MVTETRFIQRARKLPVEIQFAKWDGTTVCFEAIQEWVLKYDGTIRRAQDPTKLYVYTKEGKMTALKGSMIMKGVDNEFYSCDPNIFARTYAVLSPID